MGIFDRLVKTADLPSEPVAGSSEEPTTGTFTPAHFPPPDFAAKQLAESRKPVFVNTPNIVLDESHAWEQDLDKLQKFWKYIYEKQRGLIEQFEYQLERQKNA